MQNDVMKSDLEQPEEVLHLSTWHWFLGLSKQKEVSTLEIFGNDHYIIHLHFIYLLYDYLWIHIKINQTVTTAQHHDISPHSFWWPDPQLTSGGFTSSIPATILCFCRLSICLLFWTCHVKKEKPLSVL